MSQYCAHSVFDMFVRIPAYQMRTKLVTSVWQVMVINKKLMADIDFQQLFARGSKVPILSKLISLI